VKKLPVSLATAAQRFAKWVVILTAADVVVGVGWAEYEGKAISSGVTGALFISGGIVFVGAAFAGGGGRGRRSDVRAGREPVSEMPFTAVLIGLALVGIGVLTVVL
jgi:hypothetical protein